MSSPLLTADRWTNLETADTTMTVNGAIQKTVILVAILMVMFGVAWDSLNTTKLIFGLPFVPVLIGSILLALVCGWISSFAPRSAVITAPIYAACMGVFLGTISCIYDQRFHGLPLLAATLTVGTLTGMLFLYTQRIIRASPLFIVCVAGATVGLGLGCFLLFVLNLCGVAHGVTAALGGNGVIGIGFSVFCVGLSAFTLILDFHFIEQRAQEGAPKYMEWVGAMGLLATLIWMYVEMLRLLSKLQSRD